MHLLIAGFMGVMGLGLAALGALTYTGTNSLAWALARPERRAYAVPMRVGAVGGLAAAAALIAP